VTDDAQPPERTATHTALLEATRALLWVGAAVDAREIAERLVRDLGAEVVPARIDAPDAMPVDLSFGHGEPAVPLAPSGTRARVDLERHLARFLIDARRALELASRTQRLSEAASTDVLTGLPNRRTINRALGRLEPDDLVIIIDLDHFKDVNDHLGHAVGDDVLRAFGTVLATTVRARDMVGRYGGEEFVVILAPPVGADAFLHRLRAEWTALRPLAITFSAGVAKADDDPGGAIERADAALYQAKHDGRDRWRWSSALAPPGACGSSDGT
jgi:diguanylate cyclase (GGDEF)-like protein